MSDENDKDSNLDKASDFFGGLSSVRETSKVTHRAIYSDMLSTLMERALEIEKIIEEHDKELEQFEQRMTVIEAKLNIIIISFWAMLAFLVVFCIVAIG